MATVYVEYALSFGVESYEGLWKIQFLHPYDANLKVQAWVPLDPEDELIGETIDNIRVAEPGEKLTEVMKWLYDRITKYPYYWPKEGTYVDKFGYDFEVDMTDETTVTKIEMTQIAYEVMKSDLNIQPPDPTYDREVEVGVEKVGAGGALVKLTVTLDRSQPVSQLSITPFTKYPMELVSVMYEEDTETYYPKKEIAIPKGATKNSLFTQTTESIRMQFPVVIAKRFTIILRQQNTEKNTYLVNAENVSKKSMWDSISRREAEVTLDTTDGLETLAGTNELNKLTGWDIYLNALSKYKTDLVKWNKDMIQYKHSLAEREAALQAKQVEETRYAKALSEYRADYKKALEKYQTKVVTYQQQIDAYNAAYAKYQKDLVVYNKYLRDYANWQSTQK